MRMNQGEFPARQLSEILQYVVKNSEFFRKKYKGLDLEIKNENDFLKIPLLTREEVLDNNKEIWCITPKDAQKVFTTGGTTGKPKLLLFSKEDYQDYVQSTIDFYVDIGIKKEDILWVPVNLGMTPGGMIFGVTSPEQIGCLGINTGLAMDPKRVIKLLQWLRPTTILCAPPGLVKYTNSFDQLSFDYKSLQVKKIAVGGTGISAHARRELSEKWGADIFMQYGVAEFGNISWECKEQNGMHILNDRIYTEILDAEKLVPIKEGEGLICATSIGRNGTPLIRYYGMLDIVKITQEKCKCGSSVPRMWVVGRQSDLINLRGFHKLYLYQIEEAFEKFPVGQNLKVILEDRDNKDRVKILVEIDDKLATNELAIKMQHEIITGCESLKRGIDDGDILEPVIAFVQIGFLPRTSLGKIEKRIEDKRKKGYW